MIKLGEKDVKIVEKHINNEKKLIISHISDIDGMGSVVLGFLAFKKIDYCLIEIKEQTEMLEFIKNSNYEQIYICDLGLEDKIGDEINGLNKNILLFDHHKSNMYVSKYDWATVEVTLNNRLTSGTELFYDYLVKEELLKPNQATTEFVELIRSFDTWDWNRTNNTRANDLTSLFTMLGTTEFINYFVTNLPILESFEYSQEHQFLINLREKEINELKQVCNQSVIKIMFEDLIAGVVFCDRHSSNIGNYLCQNQEIDFAMIVNLLENRVSLRSEGEIDVGVIAKKYGGGGHKNAAGFSLTNNDKKTILKLIIDNIN